MNQAQGLSARLAGAKPPAWAAFLVELVVVAEVMGEHEVMVTVFVGQKAGTVSNAAPGRSRHAQNGPCRHSPLLLVTEVSERSMEPGTGQFVQQAPASQGLSHPTVGGMASL